MKSTSPEATMCLLGVKYLISCDNLLKEFLSNANPVGLILTPWLSFPCTPRLITLPHLVGLFEALSNLYDCKAVGKIKMLVSAAELKKNF